MKTLKINEKLHNEIKKYCEARGIKINFWVEEQLKLKIKELLNE